MCQTFLLCDNPLKALKAISKGFFALRAVRQSACPFTFSWLKQTLLSFVKILPTSSCSSSTRCLTLIPQSAGRGQTSCKTKADAVWWVHSDLLSVSTDTTGMSGKPAVYSPCNFLLDSRPLNASVFTWQDLDELHKHSLTKMEAVSVPM